VGAQARTPCYHRPPNHLASSVPQESQEDSATSKGQDPPPTPRTQDDTPVLCAQTHHMSYTTTPPAPLYIIAIPHPQLLHLSAPHHNDGLSRRRGSPQQRGCRRHIHICFPRQQWTRGARRLSRRVAPAPRPGTPTAALCLRRRGLDRFPPWRARSLCNADGGAAVSSCRGRATCGGEHWRQWGRRRPRGAD